MVNMKYTPEPVEHGEKWSVRFEEDGGYIFDDQDDAMIFCLLLEVKDLLDVLNGGIGTYMKWKGVGHGAGREGEKNE